MPTGTLNNVNPNPPDVVMLGVDGVGPVTVKPKVSSPPIVFFSIRISPGVSKVESMNVHITVPKAGKGKFVGENDEAPPGSSAHVTLVRPQPIGMVVSATV